jgi:hypothetical protein
VEVGARPWKRVQAPESGGRREWEKVAVLARELAWAAAEAPKQRSSVLGWEEAREERECSGVPAAAQQKVPSVTEGELRLALGAA